MRPCYQYGPGTGLSTSVSTSVIPLVGPQSPPGPPSRAPPQLRRRPGDPRSMAISWQLPLHVPFLSRGPHANMEPNLHGVHKPTRLSDVSSSGEVHFGFVYVRWVYISGGGRRWMVLVIASHFFQLQKIITNSMNVRKIWNKLGLMQVPSIFPVKI